MANSPSIVIASLSDDQLKKSIESLVTHVDEAMKKMVQSTNNAVGEMEAKLKSLGNLKIDSSGTADGGASKRTKAQNTETDAVEKNVAARERQIKKNQEAAMSFDNFAKAQQVAIRSANPSEMRNADTLQTMNIQLDLLRERLREARQQYSSFVALAAHATTTGDKGLFQYATDGVHRYEQEVRNLIPQIRTLQSGIQQMGDVIAPQGHTIQNYVNSLQKANPELAALNAQYKSGTSLLQDQSTSYASATQSAQRYTEEIRKQAQAIRESAEYKAGKNVYVTTPSGYDATINIKDRKSIEDKLTETYQKHIGQKSELDRLEQTDNEVAKERLGTETAITNEISKRKKYSTPETQVGYDVTRDKLAQIIATRNNIERNQVVNWDEQTSSIKTLSAALKQYQDAYVKMSATERNSPFGKQMIADMQVLERNIQKFRQQMARPIDFESVMNLPQKTLDDIAYKMRQLASYRSGLNVDTQRKEIQQVNDEYNRLKKRMDEVMQKNQQMIASNTALGRSWNYMKNRLAFYFTVGASTSFIKNLIEVRSQYEMNEKALGILLDSASRGTRIFNELSQMALVSPYTLIELSNAAKQLTAYDIAAKDVVDTTRRLADMASAVGVPVERLTYALGQIKAYGYLNSRDARMFANAGIPLVKQLADRYSELEGKMVSTADVYDRMKKKAIDYNDVMAVINKMTDEGGKFFDFQAKMAETLKVRIANLTLAWNNMLNDMGKDNQGVMATGLKGLTVMFKHWREIYRVMSTLIVALGAYRVATMLAGMTTKTSIGGSAVASWISLARGIKSAKDATALFSLTLKSIPFTAWFTAIATLASYFILFNNSSDDVKQKLEDIKSAFDGVRKEVETLFADAIKTDNIGTQLTKLRDMLELAETELGVTIPIKLEDVNESNIKQKLNEAKQFVDEYINFSQTFSEAAAGTKFNEFMNDFGSKARSTYTNVTESINSVVVALQELSDKGQASKRDIEILNELTSGQKEDESRIEYLQRLVSLYEELGLIGQEKVEPMIGHNFFKAFFSSTWDNMEELERNQEENLDRLGIKNKSVFENMLKDVQGYYNSSSIAAYQFERQVMRVAEKIDINNIPVEQRTMKLTAAINEEASQNNWNQFEKEFARQIANEKFGTTIEISDESKKAAEEDLQAWQRNIKEWAKNNSITFDVSFQTNDTEASYAKRMLQEAKDAKELWETLGRKEKQGTGSKDATTKAYNDYIERRKLAAAAGADLSSLDAKSRKAAKQAESELQKALKEELSTIDKVRSIYKDLTKEGMSHANAVERATKGWDETVNAINRVLQKNGLRKLDLSKFAGIENPRELVNMLQSQLNTLLKRGAKPAEIKELQTKIRTLNVDAEKYDLTKITKGLNNELGKLKDEYELAVELDANPEMGNMFTRMFGLDTTDFPRTIGDYMNRVQQEFDKARMKLNLGTSLNVFKANTKQWYDWGKAVGYSKEQVDDFKKSFDGSIGVAKKWAQDTVKQTQDLQYKLADNNGKIAIEEEKLAILRQRLAQETNEEQKRLLDLQIQDQQNAIDKLKESILEMLPTYQRAFGQVAEHSAWMTRRLMQDYKTMLVNAQKAGKNENGKYVITDPISGEKTEVTENKLGKEIKNADKELQKTQSTVKKITEAFKKGEDGVVDWVHGVELVGEELGKLSNLVDVVGQIADALGNPDEYNATAEAIHDISSSINGIATAAQGIGQFASGDYIGGAASILSGVFTTVSAWMDNSDKKISAQVKESERAIRRLENAYKELENTATNSYGALTSGAKEATLANKELQLIELKRQLTLEQSRSSKKRDEDKIEDLKGQIIDLKNEINNASQEVINDLLGTSSAGDGITALVEAMVDAFRNGEDAMEAFGKKWDEMIDNMILKLIVTKYMQDAWDELMSKLNIEKERRLKDSSQKVEKAQEEANKVAAMSDEDIATELAKQNKYIKKVTTNWMGKQRTTNVYDLDRVSAEDIKAYRNAAESALTSATESLNSASLDYTKWSIDYMTHEGRDYMTQFANTLKDGLGEFYTFGQDSDKQLSALQQGLQSMSENTAGALEAYMNGVSQQVYLHSQLLTEIRDAVVGFNFDVQVGTMAEMLLQLQQSYQVQMSIESILRGVLNPSEQAIKVELLS